MNTNSNTHMTPAGTLGTGHPALSRREQVFVEALVDSGVTRTKITRGDMRDAMNALGLAWPPAWIVKEHDRRAGRGYYDVPEIADVIASRTPAEDTVVVLNENDGTEHVVADVDADAIAELQNA